MTGWGTTSSSSSSASPGALVTASWFPLSAGACCSGPTGLSRPPIASTARVGSWQGTLSRWAGWPSRRGLRS
eukprot:contig_21521_g5312